MQNVWGHKSPRKNQQPWLAQTERRLLVLLRVPPNSCLAPSLAGGGPLSDAAQAAYDLTGVVFHKGKTCYHGHYIAHCRDWRTGQWLQADDDTVEALKDYIQGRMDMDAGFYIKRVSGLWVPPPPVRITPLIPTWGGT